MKRFVFHSPIKPKLSTATDALVNYRKGKVSLLEAKTFLDSQAKQFAEPSKRDLDAMRKSWQKHAPEKAKGLYLR